ncbi:MAG: hypothetical protein OXT09_00150 [Myxococcales bacterium]|nr:hypothetical protein [Myxococcales bacterium]
MRPREQLALGLIALIATACNIENEGDAPPRATLYFPNALGLLHDDPDAAARHLLVTNSNFDLRYNAGTLQAYDLAELGDAVAGCVEQGDEDCELEPGEFLADEIHIGSFSNGLAIAPGRDRAFVASRTDKSLSVIELDPASDDDIFTCGDGLRGCTRAADLGEDPETGKAVKEWIGDPVVIMTRPMSDWLPGRDDLGDYVMVGHLDGEISLFTQGLDDDGGLLDRFQLTGVLERVNPQLTGLAFDDTTGQVHLSFATVVPTNRGKGINRVAVSVPDRVLDSGEAVPDTARARIFSTGVLVLEGVGPRTDTRDIEFIAAPEPEPRALVLAREPNALLLADLDETRNRDGVGRVLRTAVLGSGPSRMVVAELPREGDALRVAVVSCFTAREIFVVDLETMLIRTVVPNLSGPFDLAVDEERSLLYVTDFRSSVIRIIDLSPLTDPDAGEGASVVATLGAPRIIQELQ